MILFGHPTGNPNSHHAALAHFAAQRLAAFCVPWMPTPPQLKALRKFPGLNAAAARLERRCFPPLLNAPRIEGKFGEWLRLARRFSGLGADERLSYEANDWLMRTMRHACRRADVTAVHAYEDCSLWQFEEAKRLDKACIYDMPIGYYPWWQDKQTQLAKRFSDWLSAGGLPANRWARPEQKIREMELADLVLAPSRFVEQTIREFHPHKKIGFAPYGVDLQFWKPASSERGTTSRYQDSRLATRDLKLHFIFAGQCSIRKGTPVLLEAWRKADLHDAQLELVGSWQLAADKLKSPPPNVTFAGPVSRTELRARYQAADVFVFPSFFEGLALAFLEAMACGLPVIGTEVVAGMDLLTEATGREVRAGSVDELVEVLRWFAVNREIIPAMKTAARAAAEKFTWDNYRRRVSAAADLQM
jgi:glycosyltransferase involved in cell wall biosynthesis